VDPLHRRDHAELPEPRDVGRVEVLRVLDPPPQISFLRMPLEGLLVNVQNLAVAAIADRMDAQLIVVLDRKLR
jgi:hypothetical protein